MLQGQRNPPIITEMMISCPALIFYNFSWVSPFWSKDHASIDLWYIHLSLIYAVLVSISLSLVQSFTSKVPSSLLLGLPWCRSEWSHETLTVSRPSPHWNPTAPTSWVCHRCVGCPVNVCAVLCSGSDRSKGNRLKSGVSFSSVFHIPVSRHRLTEFKIQAIIFLMIYPLALQ